MSGTGEVSIQVLNRDGLMVAKVVGPMADARREAMHYAAMYYDEGPIELRERRLIRRSTPSA